MTSPGIIGPHISFITSKSRFATESGSAWRYVLTLSPLVSSAVYIRENARAKRRALRAPSEGMGGGFILRVLTEVVAATKSSLGGLETSYSLDAPNSTTRCRFAGREDEEVDVLWM